MFAVVAIIGTGGDGSPPSVDSCSGELLEDVPVHEVMNHLVVANIPGEVLLKDAVGVGAAELIDDGVESALGGDALPSAVKDLHEVVTDLGDQVAMQANLRDAVFGADLGVLQSPVLVCLDGGVHECFDLTHVVLWFVWYVPSIRGAVPPVAS